MPYIELTGDNFQKEVLESTKPVLVDFWAPWCGPCRALAPTLEELAEKHSDKVTVGKLNVDENPELATKYHVMSIPTLLLFKDGQIDKQHIGLISTDKLIAKFSL
ncbi:MAG: thioredoxin [Candidatus Stygibacter australis]|nr:thioredoxin [Candidatus Stygibacter australis]MDP8321673.1 thioredoxin [Candidatus Stygibacter australis]